ncbi:MAG: FMN-binding protein [Acidimicrobiales bacterium]|jgi:uncharacterized protein with FMN-binding domain
MRRVGTVVASVAGFAGIVALHAGNAPSLPGATAPPAPVSSVPGTTTPTTTAVPVTGTAVGTSEQYGYGVLAVKVTEQSGHITDVSVASLQTAEQYSQNLAQQVIPMLRSEVLSAQSAQINAISGATYTSQAYAASVQSALDALAAK